MDSQDGIAGREVLLEHARWVRQLARELVRDPAAADDLAQETWLAFLRARPDLERPLRPWLARVLRNAAGLGVRRRAARAAREESAAAPEGVPSAHELVERAEEQQRLARAVLELDEPYRSTLLLRYYEGLAPSAIARLRALPAATVRSHLHRGLERLRRRLDAEHGGDRRAWVAMLEPLLHAPGRAATWSTAALLALPLALVALIGLGPWRSHTPRAPASLATSQPSSAEQQRAEPSLGPAQVADRMRGERRAAGASERELSLVDAAGRALSDYAVRVDGELLRSDAAGRLLVPAGARALVPIDDERLALEEGVAHGLRARRPPAREPLQIPAQRTQEGSVETLVLPAGPRIRLELSAPAAFDLGALEASLALESADATGAPLARQIAPLRTSGAAELWVRFADGPAGPRPAGARARLELRDRAGLWLASSSLPLEQLDTALRLRLVLERTAAVTGRLLRADGAPSELALTLHPADDEARIRAYDLPDAEGRFALRWIAPGEYLLRARGSSALLWEERLQLIGGEILAREIALEAEPPAGRVSGSVTSASNAYAGQLLVFLLDGEGRTLDVFPTAWSVDAAGLRRARFRFDSAPAGALRLELASLADASLPSPLRLELDEPREGLSWRIEDERPSAELVVEPCEAENGLALERFELELRVAGGLARLWRCEGRSAADPALRSWTFLCGGLRWNRFESAGPLRRFPDELDFEWTLRAEGFRPARGTRADFESAGPGRRLARIALERE